MKAAMKSREKERLSVVRMVIAALKDEKIAKMSDLSDAEEVAVVTRMVKQRRDSANQYRDAGRPDLADNEESEVVILTEYLPPQLDEAAIDAAVAEAIAASGATAPAQMGKVMGLLTKQVAGQADMGVVSQKVKAALATGG